jgi:hypothetical protein
MADHNITAAAAEMPPGWGLLTFEANTGRFVITHRDGRSAVLADDKAEQISSLMRAVKAGGSMAVVVPVHELDHDFDGETLPRE